MSSSTPLVTVPLLTSACSTVTDALTIYRHLVNCLLNEWWIFRNFLMHIEIVLSQFSHVWLFATLWTVARQASLSMGFPRQESWNGLHFHLQGIKLHQNWFILLLVKCLCLTYFLHWTWVAFIVNGGKKRKKIYAETSKWGYFFRFWAHYQLFPSIVS